MSHSFSLGKSKRIAYMVNTCSQEVTKNRLTESKAGVRDGPIW